MRHIFILLCLFVSHLCIAMTGDGNITAEKRMVTEFRELTINGPFQIVFSNDPHSDFIIKIETEKNLQQYVTVTQDGLAVFVNVKAGMCAKDFSKLLIYVNNRDIHSLTVNASTNEPSNIIWPVICPGAHLKITGSIPISIKVKVTCHNVGPSKNALLDKMNNAKLIAEIDNAGKTKLSGDVEEADILNSGTGELKAYDLFTDIMRIKNTSAASAEVNGEQQFFMNNAGSGHIYYSGEGKVSELKETIQGSICKEEYLTEKLARIKDVSIMHKNKIGFNTDSLFALMLERDQKHRKDIKAGDTLHTTEDDTENFAGLKWYLDKYGYPVFDEDQLTAMFPTLLMHIDNYDRFISIKPYLLKALKDGKLSPNTYAYSYDRSLTAAHMRPMFFYWNDRYKPDTSELKKVNNARHEIGLADYPLLFNGKNF